MKWINLIGLLICGAVNAQSVICERYGALPGEPQQTFNRRCPAGYNEVGQVGGSSRSSGYIPEGPADRMLEEQRERNEYIRESLEQAISRSRSQAVASGQSRQQAAFAAYLSALTLMMSSQGITPQQWRLFLGAAADISSTLKNKQV